MRRGTQHADPERGWTDEALRARDHRATTDAEWSEHGEPERYTLEASRIAERVIAARVERRPLPKAVDLGEVMGAVLGRAEALAPWAAAIAEGDEVDATSPNLTPVRVWRWHHLGGAEGRPVRLLAEREADLWILDAWRAAPIAGRLGPDGEVEPHERLSDLASSGAPLEWRRRVGRRWVVRSWRAPREHEALYGLARLVADLSRRFSWEPAEATAFVLCGVVPAVQPIRGRVELRAATSAAERAGVQPRGIVAVKATTRWPARPRRTVDGFARVVVELDPTLTPDELAAWWREVREQLEPEDGWPGRGEVWNELGRWLASNRDGSWSELQARWNESHPGREIPDRSNFAKSARTAVRRLLSLGVG